jgi:hypothetical protein
LRLGRYPLIPGEHYSQLYPFFDKSKKQCLVKSAFFLSDTTEVEKGFGGR